ncbi:MAG: hypothetical protein ABSB58_09240 [Gemmatimonadales bacterium]|jgi:hypothetical protein
MPSPTLATRLPEPLLREVQRFAKRGRLGPSEALRAIVAEWVTLVRYPAIEFRDGPAGRRPALRGGPDVWEVAMAARDAGQDAGALRAHLGVRLSAEALGEALAYAAEHRDEIEGWIAEAEAVRRAPRRRPGTAVVAASPVAAPPFDPGRVMREAAARMTVERKLEVSRGLRDLAWDVKAAAIRSGTPDLPESGVQERVREVFLDALR